MLYSVEEGGDGVEQDGGVFGDDGVDELIARVVHRQEVCH